MDKDKFTKFLKGYNIELHVMDHWGSASSYNVHKNLLEDDSKLVKDALQQDEDLFDITLPTTPFLGVEAIEAYLYWLYRDIDIKTLVDNEESIQEHKDKNTCRVRAIRDLYIVGCVMGSSRFKNAIMDQFICDMIDETITGLPRHEFRTFFDGLRKFGDTPILKCLVVIVHFEIESCNPEIAAENAQLGFGDHEEEEYSTRGWLELTDRSVPGGIIQKAFNRWHNTLRRSGLPLISPAEAVFYERYGQCFFHSHDPEQKCPPKTCKAPVNRSRDMTIERVFDDSSTTRDDTPFSPETNSIDEEMADGEEIEIEEDASLGVASDTPLSSPVARALPYRPSSMVE